ncbi:hypothetical protein BRM3_09085 [Brachybacterium huguangmaarense]|uniref:Uncharacterized protein n=1 Tax=Brachybacterium huguangmaarense TaxID=1652028 RepID=A0ABY6FZE2_9MICO|nr:hypothetical protein [Brachybacterium huguangmaarense]UYG15799.1 hypothetical protein BRM3_09085 [Brachybacterium huguangmaarense]
MTTKTSSTGAGADTGAHAYDYDVPRHPGANGVLTRRAGRPARVNYHRLSVSARDAIRWSGLTIADYVRSAWPDGVWRGDACGCTDERCTGHHHDETEDCLCLPALIDETTAAAGKSVAS